MIRLQKVEVTKPYTIRLVYSDGTEGEVDLNYLRGKGVFKRWETNVPFNDVHISEHNAISWSDELELCPDALYMKITGKPPKELFGKNNPVKYA